MSVLEFAVTIGAAGIAEYFVFKYLTSDGKFKASSSEKLKIQKTIREISIMRPQQMIAIARKIKDDLAPASSDSAIRQLLQFTWGLSEEVSDQIADRYGTQFSAESKRKLDEELLELSSNYAKGQKLEVYDSISLTFKRLFTRKEKEIVQIDRVALAASLKDASNSLAIGKPSIFMDVLSKYAQQPFQEEDILLFMNAINDLFYRIRSELHEGPSYYSFVRSISKDMLQASKAIQRNDRLTLYNCYENILRKAERKAIEN